MALALRAPDAEGAVQMLIELGIQCDLVDAGAALESYRLVVVPDGAAVDETLRQKLAAFVGAGGALIFSGTAATGQGNGRFPVGGRTHTLSGARADTAELLASQWNQAA